MLESFSFPKSVRLLTSEQYSDVFQKVEIRVSSKHFLILARKRDKINSRIGIIVAKKHVKLAVQRNRIKRLLRESFRHERHQFTNLDMVVLAKKNASSLSNIACAEELQYLWRKLKQKQNSLIQKTLK